MWNLDSVDHHATGLTALAALLAVLIGPLLQMLGSIRQGRSQAVAAFSSNLTHGVVSDISLIIGLATDLYSVSGNDRRNIERRLYECQLRVSLVVGSATSDRECVNFYLNAIRDGAKENIKSDQMEYLISELIKSFENVLKEERKNILSGK